MSSRAPDPLRLIVIIGLGIYVSVRAVAWLGGDVQQARPQGSAVVEGTVLGRDDQPVELANVRVWNEEMRVFRAATTDADGKWRLSALPGATYRVTAAKRGYVNARLPGASRGEQIVSIRDGQVHAGVTVHLMLGSTVSGVVYDEFGQPAAGRYVRVLRKVPGDRPTFVDASDLGTTDAGGRYLIAGVAPGDVFVMASLGKNLGDRVYFPAARRVVDADAVTLEPGEARTDLNLRAPPLVLGSIEGLARTHTGAVIAGTRLSLVPASAGEPDERHLETGTRGDGSFLFERVPADTYWIAAQAQTPDGLSRRQLWGTVTVTVDGRAVALTAGKAPVRTTVELEPGHLVVGHVIVRASSGIPPLAASAVPVRLVPDDARTRAVMRAAYPRVLARADGEFSFDGVPSGRYRLDATVDRPWTIDTSPTSWPTPGSAFDVVRGRPVTGLVLAVTDAPVPPASTAASRR
jgi:hypothetical protein